MDRFFDDANIKQRKLQNTADKIRNIKQKVSSIKQQVDNLPDEAKEQLIHKSEDTEVQSVDIPHIQKEQIMAIEEIDGQAQEVSKKKRGRKKKIIEENIYEQDIQKILEDSPELTPELKGTQINIQATLQQPIYNITREKGKVKAETESFINQLKKDDKELINREILINKQNETNNELASMQIELEIITRMKLQIDDKLKPIYDGKITKIQSAIKELELRAATIANLIAGR